MKLSDAKMVIKEIYKTNSVTALVSERGVGKTSAYKQCAEELGIGYIDLYAAALEGPDFMGLPDKNSHIGITEYLAPRFLPTIEAIESGIYPEKGILVLEEINRVSSDTISVLYPLLLDRKINGHEIGNGWKLGVTMNPDNMNYIVNSLDDALIDRFITLTIEPNIVDYLEYSKTQNYNIDVISFLEAYPDMLCITNKNSEVDQKSPTPRGWTQVQNILNSCTINKDILFEVVAGIIGTAATASFFGYIDSLKVENISADSVILDYSKVKKSIDGYIRDNKVEELTKLITSIASKTKSSLSRLDNINLFLNSLPDELLIIYYKELAINNPDFLEEISDRLDTFDKVTDSLIDIIAG